jgi:hypothetical protein
MICQFLKSKIKATADYALFYDVYFGEAGKPEPVTANNGESLFLYLQNARVYTMEWFLKCCNYQFTKGYS